MKITDAELDIMEVVWAKQGRITTREIMEQMPEKKMTTVSTLAGRLIEKGLLQSEKTGRAHAHEYWAVVSQADYKKMQTKEFVDKVHKGSALSLISALVSEESLSEEDMDAIQNLLGGTTL